MKKMIITGATSNIIKNFLPLIEDMEDLQVITCGRSKDSDYKFDFFDHDDCLRFAKFLKKEKPNYLFVNHGLLVGKELSDYKKLDFHNTLYCNQVSQLLILESIVDIKKLRTVVTSSISGKLGSYDMFYAATKAAVDLAIGVYAKKLPKTSRLNAISPGIISDAKMTTKRTDLKVLEAKRLITPTQTFTTSLEIAKLAHYIFFESANLNGENINVNGGLY